MNESYEAGSVSSELRLFPSAVTLGGRRPETTATAAVIMRTKNRPLLLPRALSSVLCQTYQTWHLYLVNDGGDRGKLESLLEDYESAFNGRLTVIHHPASLGMENASNAALSRACEEFAVVHDDDDSWHPEFLETTVAFLADPANANCVGVTTGCTVITERLDSHGPEEVARTAWSLNRGPVDMCDLLAGNTFPPICLLFRRAAVERIGPFNGELPVLGDWDFNIRLLTEGDIDFLDRDLANYHHRVQGGEAAYGNTVIDGHATHERQNVLLRNSILRAAIASHPATLGAVQALLFDQRRTVGRAQDIDARLQAIEAAVRDVSIVAAWVRKMLRPVRWIWVRALPLRRRIARLRGRY